MKTECELCATGLTDTTDAMICSFECTYCIDCAEKIHRVCKNCEGELTPRPKRKITNQFQICFIVTIAVKICNEVSVRIAGFSAVICLLFSS